MEEERAREQRAREERAKLLRDEASKCESRDAAASALEWNSAQTAALVKALTLYKPGCANRWVLVAEYVNSHARTSNLLSVTPQTAIERAKLLQRKGSLTLFDIFRLVNCFEVV